VSPGAGRFFRSVPPFFPPEEAPLHCRMCISQQSCSPIWESDLRHFKEMLDETEECSIPQYTFEECIAILNGGDSGLRRINAKLSFAHSALCASPRPTGLGDVDLRHFYEMPKEQRNVSFLSWYFARNATAPTTSCSAFKPSARPCSLLKVLHPRQPFLHTHERPLSFNARK